VLCVTADSAGKLKLLLDSVDEGADAMGLPGDNVLLKRYTFSYTFSFDIPDGGDNYQATVSTDGNALNGTWTQEGFQVSVLLVFTRTSIPVAPTPHPIATRPPVALENLQAIIDQELKPVLERGLLNKASGGGLVIGVLDHGERRIFAFGTAHPDSIFEIGSITKTFTGLILAQMVLQKKISLKERVSALLPTGFVGQPSAHEITLLDLATQHSGLPSIPDNWLPENSSNPFANYDAQQLGGFLTAHDLAKPPQVKFLYSNLGFGLLGYALALRAGVSYGQLVQTEITGPLKMPDTVVTMSSAQHGRLIQGNDRFFNRADPLDFGVLAGAGALKSTASDMLTYLDANLHPEKYAAGAAPGSPRATLPAAIPLTTNLAPTRRAER
jgi:D-alanyl-D-alanine-carboxypeptidase/D-alanyl-D-alanine-endopeptidase